MAQANSPGILITGATGNVGRELAKALSAQGVRYRALVRTESTSNTLSRMAGAEIVTGDFNDELSIANALDGVDRAFLLTNSSEHAEALQLDFVDVATRRGVKNIVKLSQWAADPNSPVRFLRYHAAVEQKIRESGMDYTLLRPNLFMQGLLAFRDPIITQGKFFGAAGDAKISAIDVRDIAAVAATALTTEGRAGETYNLTGPEALTHRAMAEKLSHALERQVEYIDMPPEGMKEALISFGMSQWQADGLIEDYAHYRRGEASTVASGVEDATGMPPRSFDSFARDYAPAFS